MGRRPADENSTYVHDLEKCMEIGRRVGVLLSRGNLAWARESLEKGWDELTGRQREVLGDLPLACIGLSVRQANAIEFHLSAMLVRDLAGYGEQDFLTIKNFGEKGFRQLHESLLKLGLKMPFVMDDETRKLLESEVVTLPGGKIL